MKIGRRIRIKSESLRKVRTNLRKLFYTALGDQYDQSMDQAEVQSSVGNQLGAQRLDTKLTNIFYLLDVSICRCYNCNSFKNDAVFFSEEIYYPYYYPPVNVKERPPKTYWLCPECYEMEMNNFKYYYKDKKYYYFHQCGTFASLEELGLDKLEDYKTINQRLKKRQIKFKEL